MAKKKSKPGRKGDVLTDMEERIAYFYSITLNKTDAHRLAGYKGKNDNVRAASAHQILNKPKVKKRVDELLEQRKLSEAAVLARLSDHAMGNIAHFADVRTSADLKEHPQAYLVKKMKKTSFTTPRGTQKDVIELELYDAQKPLELMGKHYGSFKDVQEQHISGNLSFDVDAALDKAYGVDDE